MAMTAAPLIGGGTAQAADYHVVTSVNSVEQQTQCKGKVTDATGEPIIGASVVVKGNAAIGTITDTDGNFALPNVKKGEVIQVSFVGYETQELKWNGSSLSVTLAEDNAMLDEIVVVGFGTQKKVNLTGAVSTVDSKTLASRPVNSVVDALQGVVAGMNFSTPTSGGTLNSTKSFNIRGTGTIGSGSTVGALCFS